MFSRRPAVRLALLVTAGILGADVVPLSLFHIYGAGGVCLLAAGTLHAFRAPGWTADLVLQASIPLFVAVSLILREDDGRQSRPEPLDQPVIVRLAGVLDSEPSMYGEGLSFVLAGTRSDLVRDREWSGRWLVIVRPKAVTQRWATLLLGTEVWVTGLAQPFPRPRNPGEFDYGRYLELNDVTGLVTVEHDSSLTVVGRPSAWDLLVLVADARKAMYEALDGLHPAEYSGFLKGLIFGYRGEISPDVKHAFMETGTIHILAVSGSNVAVIALVAFAVLGFLRIGKREIVLGTMLAAVFYMLLTGSSPSVIRATIMAIVVLGASFFERKSDIYNSVATAGVILLVWEPRVMFDVGFQLSFAAVVSIVFCYPRLEELIRRIPERFEEIKAIDATLKLFAVSLAAQIGTIPFSIYYFGRLSVISLVANLIVVPVSGLNVLLGCAELGSFVLHPWIAGSFAAVNDALIWFLLGFVHTAAQVPYAAIDAGAPGPWFPVVYYGLVVVIFHIHTPGGAKRALFGVLLAVNMIVWLPLAASGPPVLRITMIDVGQGDAILMELPHGGTVLIDAGPRSPGFDAGERIVAPYLRRHGIRTIDGLVVSHPHTDHTGGMDYLLGRFSVRTFIDAGLAGSTRSSARLMAAASAFADTIVLLRAGNRVDVDPSVRVYVLHPVMPADSSHNLNNTSLVLKVQFGSTTFLAVGDAEHEAEEALLQRYRPMLRADVLKAGHHGSATSSTGAFLDAVGPSTALVSVGEKNKFRHPSPDVIRRLSQAGADVMMSRDEGAVILESDGRQWRRVEWRAKR